MLYMICYMSSGICACVYVRVYEYVCYVVVSCQDPTDGELREPWRRLPAVLTCKPGQFTSTKWRKTTRPILSLIPSAVSLRIAGVEQFYQVKRVIGGIGNVLFLTHSQTLNG